MTEFDSRGYHIVGYFSKVTSDKLYIIHEPGPRSVSRD